MSRFTLSCESTIDLPYAYAESRDIPVLFYTYTIDGQEYPDDMGRDPEALPRFYRHLAEGALPTTSQLNTYQYEAFFEPLLQRGGDVLHVAFGSGMTASVRNAEEAAAALRERYPGQRLVVVDSLCSSAGYGLLVDAAADLRDAGESLEAVEARLLAIRNTVHHQFFSVDLKYFRRSGRVSGPAATLGSILNICPIMRLDDRGRIIAYDKVRGRKNAIRRTLDTMERHAQGGRAYSGKCLISHSNAPDDAAALKAALLERFPNVDRDLRICDICTIIAAHCGPGTVAVFFFGDERDPE